MGTSYPRKNATALRAIKNWCTFTYPGLLSRFDAGGGDSMEQKEQLRRLASAIANVPFAMMTTVKAEGRLHTKPMVTQKIVDLEKFEGTLWFFTRQRSGKVSEIGHDRELSLTYVDPDKHIYVSVSGTGVVSRDRGKMKELWNPLLKTWFPQGLEDPDLVLLRVDIDYAEIWEHQTNSLVHFLGLAKSIIKGKTEVHNTGSEILDLRH